jgi:nucleotide-binding universal stress UspA family protein
MYKHILFPTDTTEISDSGFTTAMNLAVKFGSTITILNIHSEFMNKEEMTTLRIDPNTYMEFMRKKATESREKIQKLVDDKEAQAFSDIILREGKPRETIIETSNEIEADLIVMVSTGRSNIKEAFIGSIAEYVVRHSDIPVLVIKAEK